MAVREILVGFMHPILRRKAEMVTEMDKEVKVLIADLLDTVAVAAGAGLAAPQIGVSLQVCVAKTGEGFLTLMNPDILWRSEDIEIFEEGCLSLPDTWVEVPRPRATIVRYRDEQWRVKERRFEGLDARVIQHEVDHLYGKLIMDYLPTDARL